MCVPVLNQHRIRSKLDKGGAVKNFVDALQQLTNPEMIFKVERENENSASVSYAARTCLQWLLFFFFFAQDWWDGVKNALEKPDFDKKRMGDRFEEMYASLGDSDTAGHGTFRKKFIKVWGGFSLNPP